MKRLLLILFIPFAFVQNNKTHAQFEELIIETMFYYFASYDEVSFNAAVAPSLTNTFYTFGARGGHTSRNGGFTFGLSAAFSADRMHATLGPGKYKTVQAGIYGEPRINPQSNIHFSMPLTLGIGNASVSEANNTPYHSYSSSYYYFQAEALLNVRLGNSAKFHVGPSYLHTSGSNAYGMTDEDLSGIQFIAGFRFGDFRTD